MKLDYKLKDIISEIQKELKEEDDIDISIQEIAAIADSQFVAAIFAFTKGLEVKLHKLGGFKRRFMQNIKKGRAELTELKDTLTKDQLDRLEMEMKIDRKKWNAKRSSIIRRITLQELLSMPVIVNKQNKYNKFNV